MKKGTLKLILILGIMIVVGFYSFYKAESSSRTNLEQIVQQSLKGTRGTYSVVVKNLKTNEEYSFDAEKTYRAGSLYKLWVMAAVIEQMQSGHINGDESLTGDIEKLNEKFNIDPELRELTKGTINFTVNSALTQMITISHNYASFLLSEKVGLSNVKLFLEKYGLSESKIGQNAPVSTAADIALFLEKLYKGELASPENTVKMISLLKAQKLSDKLPKYLPNGTVVAHKTGELDFLTHDAGIVYTDNGDYIIVVFSESDYPPGAKERIAQISKAVYNYFLEKAEKI